MGVKLIAIDMDDTLLNDERVVSPRNRQAIAEAVKRGVVVTVSTGRMYKSALPFAKELKLDVPLIVYNGAMIKTSFSQEVIFHQPVAREAAREIFGLAKKNKWYLQSYINDNLYVSELNWYAQDYAAIANVDISFAGEELYDMDEVSTKIMIQAEAAKLPAIIAEIKEQLTSEVALATSKPTFLEITGAGVTKGAALARLAKRLGIAREDIMAIGDSGNDVAMLNFANWSVAVANATDAAKAAARFHTLSNNQDGVAAAIEKYVLS